MKSRLKMRGELLNKYLDIFGRLHRHRKADIGYAPHKPLLLLALLDEMERGNIKENLIPATPELVATFRAYWKALVSPQSWRERIVYPFRYLIQEGFWEVVKDGVPLTPNELGHPTWLNELNSKIDGARFVPDLWQLLQDRVAINALRKKLLEAYFSTTQTEIEKKVPADPIREEVNTLIAEARSPFRVKKKPNREDVYFVRHSLFPRVIRSLYDNACAVCRLDAGIKDSTIVDAAHILPFHLFHNDDPRNGIALCKNHHWGFDAGWFTITEEFKVLVSTQLHNGLIYITSGSQIYLPNQSCLYPDLEALSWHRINRFVR